MLLLAPPSPPNCGREPEGPRPALHPGCASYQQASRLLGRGCGGLVQQGSEPVQGPQLHICLEVGQVQGQF